MGNARRRKLSGAGVSDPKQLRLRAELAQSLDVVIEHHRAGRHRQAKEICRAVIRQDRSNSRAWHLLGLTLSRLNGYEAAADSMARAISLDPASATYREAMGDVLRAQGRKEAAIAAYRQALELNPELPGVHCNIGTLLDESGATDAAIAHLERAIALNPDIAQAHSNLCFALDRKGQFDRAIDHGRRAVQLRPDLAQTHFSLAGALMCNGQLADAVAAYEAGLALTPDNRPARMYLSFALLLKGDFERGWREYEFRFTNVGLKFGHQGRQRPMWQGEPLDGKVILLHREQGHGDTFQFLRFVPMVAAKGARVVLEISPDMKRLLAHTEGAAVVTAWGESRPEFDLQCPLPSLPRMFGVGLHTVPAAIPYIRADPGLVEHWKDRLAGPEGLRVGLVWAGSPTNSDDRNRSLHYSELQPLSEIPGVAFFSLQKGPACARVDAAGPLCLTVLGDQLDDFADTAAVLDQLDVVITVDTAVAHLAGAMGKRTWVMLQFAPDWRWMLDRTDSPWYPTVRLFRQCRPGEWGAVVDSIGRELAALAAAR